jgi:hypothetical protein
MMEISSKLSAKIALIKPINENNIAVKNKTVIVSNGLR